MALEPESSVWVDFARSMAPMMMMASQELSKLVIGNGVGSLKVLDIAAGHGLFGIAVLRSNSNATVTAVDWKNVLEVAGENAQKFGVAERYRKLPGSIFEVDIGSGYDLVLIPNFLHHFDVETNEKLLRNCTPHWFREVALLPSNLYRMTTGSAHPWPRPSRLSCWPTLLRETRIHARNSKA
jgi:2-polyprenyl-3-methyl-5-hydroxy-6-metoxy-1,4-benzoquinol methylase